MVLTYHGKLDSAKLEYPKTGSYIFSKQWQICNKVCENVLFRYFHPKNQLFCWSACASQYTPFPSSLNASREVSPAGSPFKTPIFASFFFFFFFFFVEDYMCVYKFMKSIVCFLLAKFWFFSIFFFHLKMQLLKLRNL